MISVTEYSTFKVHIMHLMVDDCGSFGLKLCMASGPEAIRFRPLGVGWEQCVRRSSVLLALLDDVFADNELAGRASAELLQGEAAHQLLVGGRALGACTG